MPYGIRDETPEDHKWMKKCIASVKRDNPTYSKERCIRICKKRRIEMKELGKYKRKK